jgi:hypothetical protein
LAAYDAKAERVREILDAAAAEDAAGGGGGGGSSISALLDARDKNGWTALMYAKCCSDCAACRHELYAASSFRRLRSR